MTSDQPLAGRTIGITAERRAEDQAVLFRRLGADVLLAPMMHTSPLADPDRLRMTTAQLIDEPPDFLVANTGIGIRTWMQAAAQWGMEDSLIGALGRSRVAVRGPKAAGAISSSKLKVWWRSPTEQLADVADHLIETGVAGQRVAFQLHGDEQAAFVTGLEAAGATVIPVPVYKWSAPSGDAAAAARDLVERSCAGKVDAVTFTAGPQVRNLFALADEEGAAVALGEAFARRQPLAGCIGPVCATVAREEGIGDPVVPDSWRLGSLVKAVAAALQAS